MAAAPPSSPASRPSRNGTISSAIPPYADAILDRIVHNAHRIELKGESMRKERAKRPAQTPLPRAGKGKQTKAEASKPNEPRRRIDRQQKPTSNS